MKMKLLSIWWLSFIDQWLGGIMFSWFISFYSSAVFKTNRQFKLGVTTNVFLQEFALDLDSHKSLVRSLNVVGKHLAEHTEDEEKARETTARLVEINRRWDAMCNAAVAWEARLQTALLQVSHIILHTGYPKSTRPPWYILNGFIYQYHISTKPITISMLFFMELKMILRGHRS